MTIVSADEQQDQRSLEQDAAGQRRPEDRRPCPWRTRRILAALPRQIDPRHRAHRRHHRQQQHGVGFGEPRFDAEQHRTGHNQTGQDGSAPRHECERGPVGQQHRADGADQRRHTVQPDPHLRPRQAQRRGGFDHGRLQPVDADRLLVADVILETDVDEIAAFDHLLGRLGEPRLVAIDRRDVEEAGQKQDQGAKQQERRPHGHGWPLPRQSRRPAGCPDSPGSSARAALQIGGGHRSRPWFRIRRNHHRDNRLARLY